MQLPYWRCRRLIASGGLPDRAGQPTQIIVHMGLDRLRGQPGADAAQAAWCAPAHSYHSHSHSPPTPA